jgi:hypothetical protein
MPGRRRQPREAEVHRGSGEPTAIRLTRGGSEALEETIGAFFGDMADEELARHVKHVQEHEGEILAWLSEQPENLNAFVEDPLGTLRAQFPELELPAGRAHFVPAGIKVELQPPPEQDQDPVVAEIFQKLWERVAASDANTTEFKASPFSVIASVGAPYPRDKVEEVILAFEAVFGISRLQTITGVQNLAFELVRRP